MGIQPESVRERWESHSPTAVCCDPDSLCSTVATSSQLVATVDRDGHSINSAGARTPHEPLSTVLMRFSHSSCAVAITLTSAHRQWVGRRPRPPLNAAKSAMRAGACIHKAALSLLTDLPREVLQGVVKAGRGTDATHTRRDVEERSGDLFC